MSLMHPVFGGQASPHPPQLDESLVGSTQTPPHETLGGAQPPTQTALTHAAPIAHWLPHAPQLFRSDVTSTHAPLHEIWGGMQPPPLHAPITQLAPPWHWLPHIPQLAGSDVRSAQAMPPIPMPGQGTVGATHAPPFAGAHVPWPFGSETQTDEQHADEFWQAAPTAAQGASEPKSMPTRARPFGCMDRVTSAMIPAPTVTVTGSLTHVGTEPGAAGHIMGNALALKSTRPVGIPVKFSTELVPGLTLKSSWTVRVAAATTRMQPTPGGTCVTSIRASPIPSGACGFMLLEQASAMDKRNMGMTSIERTFM